MKEIPSTRRADIPGNFKALCASCERETNHVVVAAHPRDRVTDDDQIHWFDDYQIIRCGGCGEVSFRHKFVSDDDGFGDEDVWFLNEHLKMYPSRARGIYEFEGAGYLPYPVRMIFEETLAALRGDQPLLAAIGMGAVIEAVCVEKKLSDAHGRIRLVDMLKSMHEGGLISTEHMKRLMVLKDRRNDAAHRFRALSDGELVSAYKAIVHLLYDQYIGPSEFGFGREPSF